MNYFPLLGTRVLIIAGILGGFFLLLEPAGLYKRCPGFRQVISAHWEKLESRAESSVPRAATIRGTVRIDSRIQPRSMAISIYSRRSNSPGAGPALTVANELKNVVLYLERNPKEHRSSSAFLVDEGQSQTVPTPAYNHPAPSIRQVNETFVPHVLPIRVGTTVEFPNGDPFFHNVFSLSGIKSFDLGRFPQGQKRAVRIDKPGIVKVFCHIHSHMSAVILVFDHPYFTVPDSKGQFLYPFVPPGKYTLVGWHERLKPARLPLTVTPGEAVAIDVVL